MNTWKEAQAWELDWHSDCLNTYGEEEKQLTYARKMGLHFFHDGKTPYNIDLQGKSVLDIGGGVHSLLLKCLNRGECAVVDPILKGVPGWVIGRYKEAGIDPVMDMAENVGQVGHPSFFGGKVFDCSIGYNVLQHTDDPAKIIANALSVSRVVRWFDWIDTGISIGHIHNLTEEKLNTWFGGQGKVETLNMPTLRGKCWYGIFKGKHYDKDLSDLQK